ncbi:MAG TPA: nuclear transport factor 2 family protein [Gemmatimonadales bacterium]|nr:nuclear transport factor 2 family protein [Gemmatimonadales bacterium]
MRHTGSLAAGAALLLLAACQPSNKPQPLTGADSTALTKIAADWAAAWNKGNVDGVVSLYTSDAVRQLPDTVALVGSNAIRTNLNSAMGTPTRPTIAIQPTTWLGRQDLAVGAGTFTFTPAAPPAPATGAAPAPPPPIAGKWLNAVVKQADGTWKIAFDAITYDAPRPAPAPAKHGR